MIHIPLILILLAGTPALSWAAGAAANADPWYEIELIVFERTGTGTQGQADESNGFTSLPPAIELTLPGATETGQSADEPVAYRVLSDSDFKLSALTNRLLNARDHTTLLHVAWRQPVTTDQSFAGVRIHSDVYREDAAPRGESVESSGVGADVIDGEAPAHDGGTVPLEGVVKLSRGRFLHLNLDLRYRKAAPPGNSNLFGLFQRQSVADERYRLQQARRVRSTELQYFDHPRFGAIVLITPIGGATDPG